MPQDRESGAAGAKFGRETAKIIAQKLGATKEGRSYSNEYLLKGKHIVIKCAHHKTGSVGISYHMLERLDSIFGAFETDSGAYKLYELSSAQFKKSMEPTRSQGPSKGKVGIVKKAIFYEKGAFLKESDLE